MQMTKQTTIVLIGSVRVKTYYKLAKDAPTEEKMKKGVDQVSDSCHSHYLTISIKKIEMVYQPYMESIITVKGQRLQVVD